MSVGSTGPLRKEWAVLESGGIVKESCMECGQGANFFKDQMIPNPFSNQTPHLGLSNLRAVGSVQAPSLTTS